MVDGFAQLAATTQDPEEAGRVIIALSRLSHPQLDAKLIDIYPKVSDYKTKVSVVLALGRFPTDRSIKFLIPVARRTWYEIVTSLNKDLRKAAKGSLEQIRKEKKKS